MIGNRPVQRDPFQVISQKTRKVVSTIPAGEVTGTTLERL